MGGRTAIEFANTHADRVIALMLNHPVVPSDDLIAGVRQPFFLSWAKDDGKWDN